MIKEHLIEIMVGIQIVIDLIRLAIECYKK